MTRKRKLIPESAGFFGMTRQPQALSTAPPPRASRPSSSPSVISTRSALLQTLDFEGDSVPTVLQRLSKLSQGFFSLSLDEVHWKLREMEGEGLVEGFRTSRKSTERAPVRYRLTAEGSRLADRERQAICELFGLQPSAEASTGS